MATTKQLLTWLELELKGWNREGPRGTRALLNEAHRILLYQEVDSRIVYDASTGDLPYQATQNNVYQYDMPANCYVLKKILIDRDQTLESSDWVVEDFSIAGKNYYAIRNIKSTPATPSEVANIMFTVNPGATTQVFKRLYYQTPRQILSDNIQHEMPGSTDMEYLYPATAMLIRSINDDKELEKARLYIEKELKPNIRKEFDLGEQGVSDFCIKRAF